VRIAILGTRGIPARYGGFETLADELSRRLAARGHEVTVYCRSHYAGEDADPPLPPRVRRIVLPSVRRKYLDTIVHALISSIHAARERYDAVLYCNAITAAVCWIPRAWSGARVLLNVDGLERNRRKWSAVGRAAYLVSERLSCRMPDAVVADAEVIRRYYREEFGIEPYLIAYGGDLPAPAGKAALDRLGLSPGGYFLYVSRLEPENNALAVVEAYRAAPGELPLVVVGDAPYAAGYIARVKAAADARVLFPGAIYGEGYRELLFHCRAFVQATEVGGTHPALVEAMGAGRLIAYHDSPENREVCGEAGVPFDARRPETLTAFFSTALNAPERYAVFPERARGRVEEKYTWERVSSAYEKALAG
jgi:glycosyltransferase involved in cell wall biosynthesis